MEFVALSGEKHSITHSGSPDICPRCHRAVHAKEVYGAELVGLNLLQVVFRCTHSKCQQLFLGTYAPGWHGQGFDLKAVYPWKSAPESFPEAIGAMSPSFLEIHQQAVAAERFELPQLVGIGLRKALEFLVKDYAVALHPGQDDEIRKTLLGPCIEKFVSDPNVKECAKRAAWLGNDETHYTRRWEDKDIGDLKRLVKLTVNWIDNDVTTRRYLAEMKQGKPS